MKKERMTLEELRELKPSLDNPIELVCDDGFYRFDFEEIKVIGITALGRINLIASNGIATSLPNFYLEHYPSQKSQKNYETVYMCAYGVGSIALFFKDGYFVNFNIKAKSGVRYEEALNNIISEHTLDLDTYTLVNKDGER